MAGVGTDEQLAGVPTTAQAQHEPLWHTHARTQAGLHTHRHKHTHARTRTHARHTHGTHTQACTYTTTHTGMHTNTQTHTYAQAHANTNTAVAKAHTRGQASQRACTDAGVTTFLRAGAPGRHVIISRHGSAAASNTGVTSKAQFARTSRSASRAWTQTDGVSVRACARTRICTARSHTSG